MKPSKSLLEFSYSGETISGMVEAFSHHWTFESDNAMFRKLFPHGLSSFMAHGATPAKDGLFRALVAEMKERELV